MTRITLPYVSNVSEATSRLLAPHGIQVAHRPDRTLRSCIMKPKDPLPVVEQSGVVYRINCSNCPSNYVGETSKKVGTRMQEHKLAIRRGEQYSQVLTHMMEYDHKFDFDNVSVVASDSSKSGRLLKEAWFSDSASINRHVDLRPAYQTMRAWETRTHSRRKCPSIRSLEHRTERICSQKGQDSPPKISSKILPEILPIMSSNRKLLPRPRQTKELFDTGAPSTSTSNNNSPHDTWHPVKSWEATSIETNRLCCPEDRPGIALPLSPLPLTTVEARMTPLDVLADDPLCGSLHLGRRSGAPLIGARRSRPPRSLPSTILAPSLSVGVVTAPADFPDDGSLRGARHLVTSAGGVLSGAGRAFCAEDRADCNAPDSTHSIADAGVGDTGLVGVTPVPNGDGAVLPRRYRTAEDPALAGSVWDVGSRRCCFGGAAAPPYQATVQGAEQTLGPYAGPDHTLHEHRGCCAGAWTGMAATSWGSPPRLGWSPGTSGSVWVVGGGGESEMSEGSGGHHIRVESVLALQGAFPMVRQDPLVSESRDTGGNGGEGRMNEGKECRTWTTTSAPQGACMASGQSPSSERLGRMLGANVGVGVMNGDREGCRGMMESKLPGDRCRHKIPGRQHIDIQVTENEAKRGLRERYPRECKRKNQPVNTEAPLKNKITRLPPGLKAEGKWELGKHYNAIGDDGRKLGTASEAGIARAGPVTRSMRRNLMKRL